MKGISVRQCGCYVVACNYADCTWTQHHRTADSARSDGLRHEAEWHAHDDLRAAASSPVEGDRQP